MPVRYSPRTPRRTTTVIRYASSRAGIAASSAPLAGSSTAPLERPSRLIPSPSRARRPAPPLCSGPGRLTQALDIRPDDDGAAFDGPDFGIVLAAAVPDLLVGPRIGISRAQDLPWRFGLAGAAGLSRPFPRARPDR